MPVADSFAICREGIFDAVVCQVVSLKGQFKEKQGKTIPIYTHTHTHTNASFNLHTASRVRYFCFSWTDLGLPLDILLVLYISIEYPTVSQRFSDQ